MSTIKASRFFDPVVLAIAMETGFKANAAADRKTVEDRAIRIAGVTSKEMEEYGETYIKRRVQFAFRNRRAEHCKNALTVPVGRQWGLTEAGVERAREIAPNRAEAPQPKPKPARNKRPNHKRVEKSGMADRHYAQVEFAVRQVAPVLLRATGEGEAADALAACKPVTDRRSQRAVEDVVWSHMDRSKVKALLCAILSVRPTALRDPDHYPVPLQVEQLLLEAKKAGVPQDQIDSLVAQAA